jgi:hypothetical protein
MKTFHDPSLTIARRADDGVDNGDQRPVDGIDHLEDRLSVVVAKDPILVLKDHDVATVEMTGGGSDADSAIRVDLHPDLSQRRSRRPSVDEPHEIHVEVRGHLSQRGNES